MAKEVTSRVTNRPEGSKARFFKDYRKPVVTSWSMSMYEYAINTVSIALDIPWPEVFDTYIEQVHKLGVEPSNKKCIRALLEAYDFYPQANSKVKRSIFDLCLELEDYYDEQVVAIAMSRHMGETGTMTALLPSEAGTYDCYYYDKMRPENRWTDDVWIHWPDGEDHSRKPRRKGNRNARRSSVNIPADSEYFHYANRNPMGNRTGDCVIRAISSAMDISWDKCLDRLVNAGDGYFPVVNQTPIYERLLINSGFRPCPQILRDGKPVTGKEFCEIMNKNRMKDDRVVAFVGTRHLAAVVPVIEDDRTIFKFEDTWDCTDCYIGEYWIRGNKPRRKKRRK